MDVKNAANEMWALVDRSELPDDHDAYGKRHLKRHLRAMLALLTAGEVTGEKAHRWLGWIQGCVCIGGGATLDDMKQINKES